MPSEQERLDGERAIAETRRYDSSPSRYQTGQRCLRKRYWANEFAGRGLEPANDLKIDALFGKAIHSRLQLHMSGAAEWEEDYARLLEVVGEELTPDGYPARVETRALFQGLDTTFTSFMKPTLDRDYEWIASELDVITVYGDLRYRTILDGVVKRRSDGMWFVIEAKTSSWVDKLLAGSRTNFQLLMEVEAMRRHFNLRPEEVGGSMLLVFDKGKRDKVERDGEVVGHRRVSPFTYWWSRGGSADGSFEYVLKRPKKWGGWDITPTWTVPGWYKFAVEKWPAEISGQVQLWPGVSFDSDMAESVIRQVRAKERHVREGLTRLELSDRKFSDEPREFILDDYFDQDFSNCSNDGGFGKECPFMMACFSPTIGRDPIGSGEYRLREEH